jgi:NAD-dependent dihydropyrimidine dehydrogenase PreA subunit
MYTKNYYRFSLKKSFILGIISLACIVAILDSCEKMNTSSKYVVNPIICLGCKKCLSVCPRNAITLTGGKAVINKSECVGCGRCVRVCKVKAITF